MRMCSDSLPALHGGQVLTLHICIKSAGSVHLYTVGFGDVDIHVSGVSVNYRYTLKHVQWC